MEEYVLSKKRGNQPYRKWPLGVPAPDDRASPTERSMNKSTPPRKKSIAKIDCQSSLSSELRGYPVCGAIGLPRRIERRDCQDVLDWSGSRW